MHFALLCEGCLEDVFALFYFKIHHNTRLVLDPSYATIDMDQFLFHNRKPLYEDVREAIPPDAPEYQGKEVELRCYVVADHSGDINMHCSRDGFLIFLNKAPVNWYSKHQSTVESEVFSSNVFDHNTAMKRLHGLHLQVTHDRHSHCRPQLYVLGKYVS